MVSAAELVTRPVGGQDLPALATLFGGSRNTRHCWCTAFCTTRTQFASGWLTGRNRHRFEAIADLSSAPMGILASSGDEPVGWCACGPRSRYAVADRGRSRLLRDRDRLEDTEVWLLPCMFVRTDHRARGVTHALVRAAVDLARAEGALALEGWPVTGSAGESDAFVGRERVFEDLGFHRVARPTPQRSIMRLQLRTPG
jgi:GNAT superfamily N-acetyltransferase